MLLYIWISLVFSGMIVHLEFEFLNLLFASDLCVFPMLGMDKLNYGEGLHY